MLERHDIGQKCFGVYLGTVVQHMTHGQLKVHIQGIYPEDWKNRPSMLPICRQITPQFAGSHDGNGAFSYPNIGSTVVCVFANGDQNLPLTFGSLLGGPNAFGQYEHIKSNSEEQSSKHMLTAGKSHYQMHEAGKISAIVFDPIRTEAKVKHESGVVAPLSVDAVESRPVCEKVDGEEISSIYCKQVLDNDNSTHGSISHSTHYFNPQNEKKATSRDNGRKVTSRTRKGKTRVDSDYVVDNLGHRHFSQLCSAQQMSIDSAQDLDSQKQGNRLSALTSNVNNSFIHDLDGSTALTTTSATVDAYSYSYRDPQKSELSTHNVKVNGDSGITYGIGTTFSMYGDETVRSVEAYSNDQVDDVWTRTFKGEKYSGVTADGTGGITLNVLSTGQLLESNKKTQIDSHINRHNAFATITQDTERGITLDGKYFDDDIVSRQGMTIIKENSNVSKLELLTGSEPAVNIGSSIHQLQSIDGQAKLASVACECTLSPTDRVVSIKIFDKATKKGCLLSMDADGNMQLSATTQIMINAPVVKMTGQSLSQEFKTSVSKANSMNITAASGDCKIKNVSLLNHKHQETQSGDVVSPQPTKIAAQSN